MNLPVDMDVEWDTFKSVALAAVLGILVIFFAFQVTVQGDYLWKIGGIYKLIVPGSSVQIVAHAIGVLAWRGGMYSLNLPSKK